MRRDELKILANELLREVDAAAIDTPNVSIASAHSLSGARDRPVWQNAMGHAPRRHHPSRYRQGDRS